MLHSAGLSKRVQAPQHPPRVMPLKRAAESNRQHAEREPDTKSRVISRAESMPSASTSSSAVSRPKLSEAKEDLSDESESEEDDEQELSQEDDDDSEAEASSSESDDSSDGRDSGARYPSPSSMTRRPRTSAGGILARCTHLPSPVAIPANSIGLTYLHGFLSAAECAEVISSARPSSFYRSTVGFEDDDDDLSISSRRTSFSSRVYDFDNRFPPGPLARRLLDRISELTNTPTSHVETMELVRYEPGQKFKHHCDDYAINERARRWSVLTYLNDVDVGGGGETEFTKLGVTFAPRQGDALWWQNCPAPFRVGEYHRSSQHQGLPPIKGVKYGQSAMRLLAC